MCPVKIDIGPLRRLATGQKIYELDALPTTGPPRRRQMVREGRL